MSFHLSLAAPPPARLGPACRRWSVASLSLGLGWPQASVWGLALVGSCLPWLLPLLACASFAPPPLCSLPPFPPCAGASCPRVSLLLRRPSRAASCAWIPQWPGQLRRTVWLPWASVRFVIREVKGGLNCAAWSSCRTPFVAERERDM